MEDAVESPAPFAEHNWTMPAVELTEVTPLIADAIAGDQRAWRELHRRYSPLIGVTARKFRLSASNVDDVSQTVWLRLLMHMKDLREPRALPGWIVTTTRNEALRMLRSDRWSEPADPMADSRLQVVDRAEPDESLHRMERRRAVRAVIGELLPQHRELFRLLLADPQPSYSEISDRLGIPIGSIGPTRARCLARLRGTSALQALQAADAA